MTQEHPDHGADDPVGVAPPTRRGGSWGVALPYQLFICSGGRAGEVVRLAGTSFKIGRSSKTDITLPPSDATVSGRHAVLERQQTGWSVRDLGSRTGTFVNGKRLTPGDLEPLKARDWLLLGSAGTAALVLGPEEKPPVRWLALQAEVGPGAFVGVVNEADVRIALDGKGNVLHPVPAKHCGGFRFRLDRERPTVQRISPKGRESEKRPLKAGDVLRIGDGRLGVRVLGVGVSAEASVDAGFGKTTVLHMMRCEIKRRRVVPMVAFGLLALIGLVVSIQLSERSEQLAQETARLDAQFKSAWGELRGRFEEQQQFVETSLLSHEQSKNRSLQEQRRLLEDRIAHVEAQVKQRMEALPQGERERFASVLGKYRRSVFLLYVEVEFPTLKMRDGTNHTQSGFGTGWIAREDGLLVTNKHVVQPWKFDAALMLLLGDPDKAQVKTRIYAWPAGEKFRVASRWASQNGFNNRSRDNLRLTRTAPDVWVTRSVSMRTATRRSRTHSMELNDLAAIKLRGSGFVPIPLLPGDTGRISQLTPIMVLGFPLGAQHLQQGRADVSASLGTVRFVRDTLAHTASSFPGNSGGPILTLDGQVVAVLNAGALGQAKGESTETFGFGIRADHVRLFLDSVP